MRAHPRSLHRVAVAAAKTRANAYSSAEMHLQAVVQIWAESGWAKFAKTGLDGFVAFSQLFLSFLSLLDIRQSQRAYPWKTRSLRHDAAYYATQQRFGLPRNG